MHASKIIAIAMLDLVDERGLELGSIGDISQRLHEYQQSGRDIAGIILQRTPLGFYAREVARFVGRLLTADLLVQGNPVIVNQHGIEWLKTYCEVK